jgi:hypothetical protein
VLATTADGNQWGPRAEGHGLVRFDKRARTMTYEVWPRHVDAAAAGAVPYVGWPVTKTQLEQYGRAARAFLPEFVVTGVTNPVVQVVDEQLGEIVYTLRIRGERFQPHVFRPGTYSVRIAAEPGPEQTIGGLVAAGDAAAAGSRTIAF